MNLIVNTQVFGTKHIHCQTKRPEEGDSRNFVLLLPKIFKYILTQCDIPLLKGRD